jgi:hypothetical protein
MPLLLGLGCALALLGGPVARDLSHFLVTAPPRHLSDLLHLLSVHDQLRPLKEGRSE